MLARFGKAKIYSFGGCNFGKRPIDMHLYAMKALGGVQNDDYVYVKTLTGADIFFDKASVGATINAIIMASAAKGVTRIFGYAKEPHVFSLIKFVRSSGIKIFCYGEYLLIEGGASFGGKTQVIPDMIEAGTFIILSIITDSNFLIRGQNPEHLSSLLSLLSSAGVHFKISDKGIIPYGRLDRRIDVKTSPYPGFPTDLQPQIAPLLASSFGGVITEDVWHGRFGYLGELSKLGLKYELSGNTAEIFKSNLKAAKSVAPDLRGGASLLISALFTEGKSEIANANLIFRGYENIVEKLGSLGADIERIT